MKYAFLPALLITVLTFGLVRPVSAQAGPVTATISGYVAASTTTNNPAARAQIKVYCQESNPKLVAVVMSDVDGRFTTVLHTNQCSIGSELLIVASWNGEVGGYHTLVRQNMDVFLQIGSPIPIPEFSEYGAPAATCLCIGIILYMRRSRFARAINIKMTKAPFSVDLSL